MNAPAEKRHPASGTKKDIRECLYEALPNVLLRVPLLPIEKYLSLSSDDCQQALLSETRVRAALGIGSSSLLSAIERYTEGSLSSRDSERMRAKTRRYLIRMSTRPTPYGLFAGVALAGLGPETTLTLGSYLAQSRTRPDMGWLLDLVLRAEAEPEIRKQLCWVANTAAFELSGRLWLQSNASNSGESKGKPVSIRATGVVKRAMSMARTPIPYCELAAGLERFTSSATTEKVEKLLTEMYEQGFFFTDLRPPLTTDDPSEYVRSKLAGPGAIGVKAAKDINTNLQQLLDAISAWDRSAGEEKLQNFWSLLEAADIPSDGSKRLPVQVDMSVATTGRLGQIIGKEAAEAADLLLRLSGFPGGSSVLTAYRQAYLSRYGPYREVLLLELLDPRVGLGPLDAQGHGNVGPSPAKEAERGRMLMEFACGCLRDGRRVLELSDEVVRRLETSEPNDETAPVSLDINVQIGARSAADIDKGEFILVIGPNLGAQAAGRNLGRFADLVGREGREFLRQIAEVESSRWKKNREAEIEAEVVYLPQNHRMANVTIRPAIRAYETPVGVTPGVNWSNSIPLNELVVGVEQNRFYVRWLRTGERVRFTAGHMLTHYNGSPAVRFLSEVSFDGRIMFSSFDWGPVERFPFLPRVQRGRMVLRPAQWRIHKDDFEESPEAFRSWLENWRRDWGVPRYICLSSGDNRLVLDLDQTIEADEIRAELRQVGQGGSIIVQELLPDFEGAWLASAGGHYLSELVVSVVLRSSTSKQPTRQIEETLPRSTTYPPASRNRPPGSEWLFVKLYCSQQFEDDIIADGLLAFAEEAVRADLANSWFFIRYSDPERHIRLRFQGVPERLTTDLFSRLSDWAGRSLERGIFSKFVFDTYERELERFGGIDGMKVSEELFAADSRSSARLLAFVKKNRWSDDKKTFLALSIDDLLASIGLTADERLAWYSEQTTARNSDVGDAFRAHKNNLRRAVSEPREFLSGFSFGGDIADLLAERRQAIAPVGLRLRELQERRSLTRPLNDLFSSFVHLHLNRLVWGEAVSEHQILGLLRRTRESLRSAPIKNSH